MQGMSRAKRWWLLKASAGARGLTATTPLVSLTGSTLHPPGIGYMRLYASQQDTAAKSHPHIQHYTHAGDLCNSLLYRLCNCIGRLNILRYSYETCWTTVLAAKPRGERYAEIPHSLMCGTHMGKNCEHVSHGDVLTLWGTPKAG